MALVVHRPYRVASALAPGEHLLAKVFYGTPVAAPGAVKDPRHIALPLPLLAGAAQEVWASALPVQTGVEDSGVLWSANGAAAFAQLTVEAASLDGELLESAVAAAYGALLDCLQRLGYPCCLRTWNFLSGIVEGDGDAERYRRFSVGRAAAFRAHPVMGQLPPAATAIGMHSGGLLIYLLAANSSAALPMENSRQLPAYQYPKQYGPQSPLFSRACLAQWADGCDLLVSGTASIVGHQSLHGGDATAQFEEILRNLRQLQTQALVEVKLPTADKRRFKPVQAKLYLNRADLLQCIRPLAAEAFGGAHITFLQGDICRKDLDVEAEVIYSLQ